MPLFKDFLDELISFLRLGGLLDILKSGNYQTFLTVDGFLAFLSPLAPIIILFEVLLLLTLHRFKKESYKVPFLIIVVNRIISRLIGISLIVLFIGIFQKYAIIQTSLTWYWFIYGYIIYELNNFIRHYLTHKVRLLWCFHSVHHAPEDINSSITLTTSFVENIYTEIFATTFCMIMGLQPVIFLAIMIIDSIWGAFVHISEGSMKNARLGFLEKIILTPSHHRVHHGRNHLYMDTNFVLSLIFGILFLEHTKKKKKMSLLIMALLVKWTRIVFRMFILAS